MCRTENDVMAKGQHFDILRKQAAAWAEWKERNRRNSLWGLSSEEHDRVIKEVFTWNIWRNEHPEIQPDLSGAVLVNTDLSYADLSRVDFSKARLAGANLEE